MSSNDSGGALVLLTACGDEQEARTIRTLLESAEIPCVIQGEQHRSMLGVIGGYIQPNVLVSSADLDRAKALLEAEPESLPDATEELGAHDEEGDATWRMARTRRRRWLGAAAIFLLFGGPVIVAMLLSLGLQ